MARTARRKHQENDKAKHNFTQKKSPPNSNVINTKEKEGDRSVIGKFYYQLPSESDELGQKLREEARAQFLQRRSKELLDNDE